jgi:1,6-anhydro-N-acetylmuramate kinase
VTDDDLLAFDTGPGNGMIDLMLQARGLGRFDENGRLAAAGRVDEAILDSLPGQPYFAAPAPKSLDRYDFPLDLVAPLSAEDAAATLVAFTAEAVIKAFDHGARRLAALIVCGGGAAQSADHEGAWPNARQCRSRLPRTTAGAATPSRPRRSRTWPRGRRRDCRSAFQARRG